MVESIAKDKELGHLSKEKAQAKWRKKRELDARLKAYEVKAKAEIEAEDKAEEASPEVAQEAPKDEEKVAKKTSRKTKSKK